MLPLLLLDAASRLLPELFPGAVLHRRALAAHAAGADREATRCFAAAARAYRRELAVEALARLRVHELMVRAGADGVGEADAVIEIVHRLNRLDRLETLNPPFELADARTVLTQWLEHAETSSSGRAVLVSAGARAA